MVIGLGLVCIHLFSSSVTRFCQLSLVGLLASILAPGLLRGQDMDNKDQLRAPIYQSSRSMADFLSRVVSTDRLEVGDSVMLDALAILGRVPSDITLRGPSFIKCGTGILSHAHEIARLSKGSWAPEIQAIPGSDTSIVSPAGKFTIFYFKNGDSAASDAFAKAVANYADQAYRREIEELGYAKPPYSTVDSTFHIYLVDLSRHPRKPYGYAEKVPNGSLEPTPSGLPRSRTFLVIDNNFTEDYYTTKGLDGALVTIFHEFHHVIQFGSYGEAFANSYFQEMSATWMEMQSSDSPQEYIIDDYLQYVPQYVNKLTDRFDRSQGGGYGQAIWLEYLAYYHTPAFVRDVWEYYRDIHSDPVTAFDQTLRLSSSDFACSYADFGEELFFTGTRTRLNSPFSDASKLPVKDVEIRWLEPDVPRGDDAIPVSLTLYGAGFGKDTVVLSIARDTARLVNANILSAVIHTPSSYDVIYNDTSRFCESFGGSESIVADVFPQPFILSKEGEGVNILVSTIRMPVTLRVAIHSTSMSEITTIDNQVETIAGGYYVNWSGKDAVGRQIPSGVYLYSVDADGQTRTGKIVVVRK